MGTQLRLRSAKVLIVHLGALGTEIVKNLVLGGLNTIEILDDATVKEEDFAAQFFLPNDDLVVGQRKLPLVIDNIKDLNNRVNLLINTQGLAHYLDNDPEYLGKYDLIIATELDKHSMLALNDITRRLSIPLYVAGLHGMFGYILADLIEHTAVAEKDVGSQPREPNTSINRVKKITKVEQTNDKEAVTIHDTFCPIKDILVSSQLPSQLNKRQLRRLSSALPITFALFDVARPNPDDVVDPTTIERLAKHACDVLEIPHTVISPEYIALFSRQAYAEFAPLAAILGGALAQDVIQFLSKKESPINNCLVLDAVRSEMPIYAL